MELGLLTKEEAKAQFDYHTEKLGLIHTFSFDEVYDFLMERRIAKQKQENFRKNVIAFEEKVKNTPGALGADPFPLEHSFADGLYIRKLTVPAKTLTVTKIHAVNHAFFLMKGTVLIQTDEGIKKITAPSQGITKAGTQRVIYHVDEVIFTTVHSTKEIDIEKIEIEVIAKDFDELNGKLQIDNINEFINMINKLEE